MMSQEQENLAREILEGVVPVGDVPVPDHFAEFVAERIAARPSPTPADPLEARVSRIESQLDEILTLLKGDRS